MDVGDGRRIVHLVPIAAPPERVWRALVDPAVMGRWLDGPVTLEPRPGGAFQVDWGDCGAVAGQVVAVDPPHRFVMDWDGYPDGASTRLTFALTATADQTEVSFVHAGYGKSEDRDAIYEGENSGWVDLLAALKRVVEGSDERENVA